MSAWPANDIAQSVQADRRGSTSRSANSDGFAVEVLDLLDRRASGNVPVEIGGADDLAADDADRRALGERAECGRDARSGREVDAAGDQCLDRFGPGRRVENLELQPMLLEDASAQPELGNAGVPRPALRHRELEHVLRRRGRNRTAEQRERQHDPNGTLHRHPPCGPCETLPSRLSWWPTAVAAAPIVRCRERDRCINKNCSEDCAIVRTALPIRARRKYSLHSVAA